MQLDFARDLATFCIDEYLTFVANRNECMLVCRIKTLYPSSLLYPAIIIDEVQRTPRDYTVRRIVKFRSCCCTELI